VDPESRVLDRHGPEATDPRADEQAKAVPHGEDRHGHPDKSPKVTEETDQPQRAEISNDEIVKHWFWLAAERLGLRDDIAAVLPSGGWEESEVSERLGRIMRRAYGEVADRAREGDGSRLTSSGRARRRGGLHQGLHLVALSGAGRVSRRTTGDCDRIPAGLTQIDLAAVPETDP
jgi:hypothetical protein